MKCSKCGADLDENAKFCTSCGASTEDNNQDVSEASGGEAGGAVSDASAKESGGAKDTISLAKEEAPKQYNGGDAPIQGAPSQNAPSAQTDSQPNKKFMKIVIGVISAAAVISVAALAFIKFTAKDPKQVVIEAFENIYKEGQVYPVEELFGLKDFNETMKTADSQSGLTLKLDSCSDASVDAFAGSGMRFEGKTDKANGKNSFDMGLIYNGMDLVTVNAYYGDDTLMAAVPELSSKVFTVDLGEGLADRIKNSPTVGPVLVQSGVDVDGLSSYFTELIHETEKAQAEGKAPFDLQALMDRYKEGCKAQENFKAALTVTKAEKGEYTMDGKEVKCQGYDVVISKESMIEFLRSSADFFLQDETLKGDFLKQLQTTVKMSEFMGGAVTGAGSMSAEELQQQTYDEAKKAVDEMIAYLDKSLADANLTVYVDKKGRIAAFSGATQLTLDEEVTADGTDILDITFDFQLKGGAYLTQNAEGGVTVTDGVDTIDVSFVKQGTYDGKELTCDLSVDLAAPYGENYNFMYTGTYSSEDGSYHVSAEAGGEGSRYVKISAAGAVDQLEKGKSIHVNMDSLEFAVMDNTTNVVISGECYYEPLSGEVLPPEGEHMDVLAATIDDWNAVGMEIIYGVMGLASQLDIPMY